LLTDSVAIATIPTPLLDTPQSITAIPKELLAQQGVSTLRDALRNSPGISLAAGEGATQGDNLTIRGFSAQNDIFLDGIRDTGNYYRDSFNYGGSACRVQTGRQRAQSKAPSRWRCSSLSARESFSGRRASGRDSM
jgi:outer membrane receptor for monomeric catechols